jgi:formate/nitrite transporter FocA (FNT family)
MNGSGFIPSPMETTYGVNLRLLEIQRLIVIFGSITIVLLLGILFVLLLIYFQRRARRTDHSRGFEVIAPAASHAGQSWHS